MPIDNFGRNVDSNMTWEDLGNMLKDDLDEIKPTLKGIDEKAEKDKDTLEKIEKSQEETAENTDKLVDKFDKVIQLLTMLTGRDLKEETNKAKDNLKVASTIVNDRKQARQQNGMGFDFNGINKAIENGLKGFADRTLSFKNPEVRIPEQKGTDLSVRMANKLIEVTAAGFRGAVEKLSCIEEKIAKARDDKRSPATERMVASQKAAMPPPKNEAVLERTLALVGDMAVAGLKRGSIFTHDQTTHDLLRLNLSESKSKEAEKRYGPIGDSPQADLSQAEHVMDELKKEMLALMRREVEMVAAFNALTAEYKQLSAVYAATPVFLEKGQGGGHQEDAESIPDTRDAAKEINRSVGDVLLDQATRDHIKTIAEMATAGLKSGSIFTHDTRAVAELTAIKELLQSLITKQAAPAESQVAPQTQEGPPVDSIKVEALGDCLRVCDEKTHGLLEGVHKLLTRCCKGGKLKKEAVAVITPPAEQGAAAAVTPTAATPPAADNENARETAAGLDELHDRQIYSRPLDKLQNFLDKFNQQILGYNPIDKLTRDLVKNEQDFRMQVDEILYIQQGINKNQREIQQQYELGTATIREQAERFRDISRLTGQDINVNMRSYVRLLRMGVKDQKTAERLMINSGFLARQIGVSAEETADMFGQWHNQLGFSSLESAQMARNVREIGRYTGLTGDNLLKAVKSGEGLLKVLRNAGVLSADTARNFLLIRAQADRLGVGDEVDQLLRGLASGVDFMDHMDAGMRAFVATAAGNSTRGGGLIHDIIFGQGSRQENMRTLAGGIRNTIGQQFRMITGQDFIDFDQLQQMSDEQRTRMDVYLSRLSGGRVRVGNVGRIFDALMEGTYTLSDRLDRIGDQLRSQVLTPAERANLEMQRMGMLLSENFRLQTNFGQAVLRNPNQNLNQTLNETFDRLGPEMRRSLLAMGNNANNGVEAATNSLNDMYARLRSRFEAAGRGDRFRIGQDRINAALADQTGAAYRQLLEDLNAAQQEIDTVAVDQQNPMTEFNAHLRDINAFLQGFTSGALRRFIDAVGVAGLAIIAIASGIGIYTAQFLSLRKTIAQLGADMRFLGVNGAEAGGLLASLAWAVMHPFQALGIVARSLAFTIGYLVGAIPAVIAAFSGIGELPIFARLGEAFGPMASLLGRMIRNTRAFISETALTFEVTFGLIGEGLGLLSRWIGRSFLRFFRAIGNQFTELMMLLASFDRIGAFFEYVGNIFTGLMRIARSGLGGIGTIFEYTVVILAEAGGMFMEAMRMLRASRVGQLIGSLFEYIGGFFGYIGTKFLDVTRAIGRWSIWESIGGLLRNVFWFFETIGAGLVESIGTALGFLRTRFVNMFGGMGSGIGTFFSDLIGQFRLGSQAAGEAANAGGLLQVLGPIGRGFSRLVHILGSLAAPLAIVMGLFEGFMAPLTRMVDGVERDVSLLENLIFGVFTGGVDTGSFLSSFIGIDRGTVADEALGIMGGALQGAAIGAIFGPWGAAIGAIIGLMVELYKVSEYGSSALRQSLAYFRSWLNDWVALGQGIVDLFVGIFETIRGYFSGDQGMIDRGLARIGDGLLAIVSNLWNVIIKGLDMLVISLIWLSFQFPAMLWDALAGLVERIAPKTAAFVRAIAGIMAAVGATIQGIWDVIAGLLTFDWDRVKQGLWTVLVSIAGALVRALYTIPDAVWEWAKAIARYMVTFPKMIRDWIASLNLRSVGANIVKWLKGVFSVAIEWISDSFKEMLTWFKGIDWGNVFKSIFDYLLDPKNLDTILTVLLSIIGIFVAAVIGLPAILIGGLIALGIFIIATLAEAILEGLGELVMGIGDELGQLWSPLGAFFQGIGAILRGLGNVVGGLVDIVGGLFGLVTGDWDESVDLLLTGLDRLWRGLATVILGSLGAIVPGLAGMLTEALAEIILTPLELIAGWIDQLTGWNLTGAVNWMRDFLHGLVDEVKGWFEYLYDWLVGHSLIPDLIMGIIRWFGMLPRMILEGLAGLGAMIAGLMHGWLSNFSDSFGGSDTFLGSIIAGLADVAASFQVIYTGLQDYLGGFLQVVSGLFNFDIDQIGAGLGRMFSGFMTIMDGVADYFMAVPTRIFNYFRSIDWSAVRDSIQEFVTSISNSIRTWISDIDLRGLTRSFVTWVRSLPASIRDALSNSFDGLDLGQMVRNFVKRVVDFVKNIDWREAVNWLKTLPGRIVKAIQEMDWLEILKGIGIALLAVFVIIPGIILSIIALLIGTIGEAIFGGIGEALDEWGAEIGGYIGEFIRSIGRIFSGIGEIFGGIADIAEGILNLDLDQILAGLDRVFGGIGMIFEGIWGAIWNGIGFLGEIIITAFGSILEEVLGLFGIDATGLTDALLEGWNDFIDFMLDMPNMIARGFGEGVAYIGQLVDDVIGWFQWLWTWLVGASLVPDLINGIIDWFGRLPGMVLGALVRFARVIGDAFRNLFNGFNFDAIMAKIVSGWGTIWNFVDTYVLTPLTNGWQALWNYIDTYVLTPLTNAWQGIRAAFNAAWDGMSAWFTEYVINPIRSAWATITGGLGSLGNLAADLPRLLGNAFGTVINGLGNRIQAFFDWALDLIVPPLNGIIRGINLIIGAVETGLNAVIDVINWLVDKAVLGFNQIVEALAVLIEWTVWLVNTQAHATQAANQVRGMLITDADRDRGRIRNVTLTRVPEIATTSAERRQQLAFSAASAGLLNSSGELLNAAAIMANMSIVVPEAELIRISDSIMAGGRDTLGARQAWATAEETRLTGLLTTAIQNYRPGGNLTDRTAQLQAITAAATQVEAFRQAWRQLQASRLGINEQAQTLETAWAAYGRVANRPTAERANAPGVRTDWTTASRTLFETTPQADRANLDRLGPVLDRIWSAVHWATIYGSQQYADLSGAGSWDQQQARWADMQTRLLTDLRTAAANNNHQAWMAALEQIRIGRGIIAELQREEGVRSMMRGGAWTGPGDAPASMQAGFLSLLRSSGTSWFAGAEHQPLNQQNLAIASRLTGPLTAQQLPDFLRGLTDAVRPMYEAISSATDANRASVIEAQRLLLRNAIGSAATDAARVTAWQNLARFEQIFGPGGLLGQGDTIDPSSGIIIRRVPFTETTTDVPAPPSQAQLAIDRMFTPRVLTGSAMTPVGMGNASPQPITTPQLIAGMNRAAGVTDIFADNANAESLRRLLPILSQYIQTGSLSQSMLNQLERDLALTETQTASLFDYLLRSSMRRGLEPAPPTPPTPQSVNPYAPGYVAPSNPYGPYAPLGPGYGFPPYDPNRPSSPYSPTPSPMPGPQGSLLNRGFDSLEEPLTQGTSYQRELLRHATQLGSLYTHDAGSHEILTTISGLVGTVSTAMQGEISRYLCNLLELETEVKQKGTDGSPIAVKPILPTTKTKDPEEEIRRRRAEVADAEKASQSEELEEVSDNTGETAKNTEEMSKTLAVVAKLLDAIRKSLASGGNLKGKKINGMDLEELMGSADLEEVLNTDWNTLYQDSAPHGITY